MRRLYNCVYDFMCYIRKLFALQITNWIVHINKFSVLFLCFFIYCWMFNKQFWLQLFSPTNIIEMELAKKKNQRPNYDDDVSIVIFSILFVFFTPNCDYVCDELNCDGVKSSSKVKKTTFFSKLFFPSVIGNNTYNKQFIEVCSYFFFWKVIKTVYKLTKIFNLFCSVTIDGNPKIMYFSYGIGKWFVKWWIEWRWIDE